MTTTNRNSPMLDAVARRIAQRSFMDELLRRRRAEKLRGYLVLAGLTAVLASAFFATIFWMF